MKLAWPGQNPNTISTDLIDNDLNINGQNINDDISLNINETQENNMKELDDNNLFYPEQFLKIKKTKTSGRYV